MDPKTIVRCIIIDYDTSAIGNIKELLKKFGDIEVLGEASSYISAKELIAKTFKHTDLIFIDLNMHDADGMELISNISPETKLCFIENNADLALKAFDYNVIDYIIKPITIDRLYKTIRKVKAAKEQQEPPSTQRLGLENMILMNVDHELKFITVKNLVCIEAKGNYTSVHLNDGTVFTTYGLIKVWEDKLPIHDFFRIHRSTIVNLHYVTKIERGSNDTGIIHLTGISKPFEISRSHFTHLKHSYRLIGHH